MNILDFIINTTSIGNNYFKSAIESLIVIIIFKLINTIFELLNNRFNKNDRRKNCCNWRTIFRWTYK